MFVIIKLVYLLLPRHKRNHPYNFYRPNNDGSIDAYSMALTKGIKPENSHFISQFGLDVEPFHELSKVSSVNHGVVDEVEERPEGLAMEGVSSDWGAIEGSSREPLPGSQPPSWSSLGDIPADISKENSGWLFLKLLS